VLIGLTEEQDQLARSAGVLLDDGSDERAVRRLMATDLGQDPKTWAALGDLGVVALTIPERFGGAGGSLVDQGVVLEQMGARVYCGPYFGTAVLAVQVLLRLSDDGRAQQLLESISRDRAVVGVVLPEMDRSGRLHPQVRATRAGVGWELTGGPMLVLDGALAQTLLVVAETIDGPSVFAIETVEGVEGLLRVPLVTMDQTRKLARVRLTATPAEAVGPTADVLGLVEDAMAVSAALLGSEQVGGIAAVLDLAVRHAKTRQQFGRPIGSFQAIQHDCATMLVELEAARSAAYYARQAIDLGWVDWRAAAGVSAMYVKETYRRATDRLIQILGGIALTWEHPAHLYLKRARSSELLLGSPAQHGEQLARLLQLEGSGVMPR
jgi:alkylation response protein AidB-like acyl-CoA dehydrogenase